MHAEALAREMETGEFILLADEFEALVVADMIPVDILIKEMRAHRTQKCGKVKVK